MWTAVAVSTAMLCGCNGGDGDGGGTAPVAARTYYTTKTPYQPQQSASTYEAAPAGYSAVFTELVVRHGSRGLSSLKYDAAMYAIWQRAAADGALTALGAQLGPDIIRLMKANALLGYSVTGISTPGYGNLSQTGIGEHQQLAVRLLNRLPDYFAQVAATASSQTPRQILVLSSGVDRAKDSASFFSGSLAATNPALKPLIVQPAALTAYPSNAPVAQAAGTNRFLLYFHALVPKTDLVSDSSDPYYATYQASQAYQAYGSDTDLNAKVNAILADPNSRTVARTVMERLFDKSFVDKIDNGTYTFANTGSYSFTSDDGKFTNTLTGDGKTTVKSLVDAVSMLYNLYIIVPGMKTEAPVDFGRYIPDDAAQFLAYLQDAQDFYQKGPGIQDANPATYKMAQILQDDFFNEVDAIARGDLSHAAKLRFTHAEIMIPLASIFGLKNVFVPVPKSGTYTYDGNPWRGENVSPYAANMQWDVYRGTAGSPLLVKMLYEEKETDFKADCDRAKLTPTSHFYDYTQLKACYGHVASP